MRYQVLDAVSLAREMDATPRPFVLDVRAREAYEAGHLPGSANIPVHEIAGRQRELPPMKATRIVVVGDPGQRSVAAANWLVLVGFPDVALLEPGIGAWTGPLEKGPPPPPPQRGPELRVVK